MLKKRSLSLFLLLFVVFTQLYAQQNTKGIDSKMLEEISKAYKNTAEDKALRNAIANNDINKLAANNEVVKNVDTYFSNKVNIKGMTNQKSSGRCWILPD